MSEPEEYTVSYTVTVRFRCPPEMFRYTRSMLSRVAEAHARYTAQALTRKWPRFDLPVIEVVRHK